ncbi:MAG: diaminopimelate epimerase [Gammaproteobacteria bacterium]|jgi:diaminopimelate epimerase|nr:diaminopimelate epimerase [Gammaproteobacteria bacterium]
MKFSKMHGAGNDFVMVDAREESSADWSRLAVDVCDRHFGVGADGLILIDGNRERGFEMTIYNPDGSLAEMCGNGIRCFARLLHERGEIGDDEKIDVLTGAGPRWIRVDEAGPDGYRVTAGMGVPEFDPATIPIDMPGDRVVDRSLAVDGMELKITALSMGNPHAVAFVDDVEAINLESTGPIVEHHPAFPRRVNFEICQVLGSDSLRMRVWERGAGITLACGSGASATVAAAVVTGRAKPGRIELQVDGGVLDLEWRGEGHEVTMTGPADRVFEGQWVRTPIAEAVN